MRVRIVVADQSEARFYDTESSDAPLELAGRLSDPKARLHDRDFKSDRPGRVFDHAPVDARHRGAVARHGTGGEKRPRKHEAEMFAREIAAELEKARRADRFDTLTLVAGPPFLGVLRRVLPQSLQSAIGSEIPKDLVHEPESVLRTHLSGRA